MTDLPEMQFTVAMIKPDAVQNKCVGEIITSMQWAFTIGDMCWHHWSPADVERFYYELRDRPFFPAFLEFMSSGPMVACTLVGPNAVGRWRQLIGPTDPRKAEPGSLRHLHGDMNGPIMRNAVHGSDSYRNAKREADVIRSLSPGFGDGARRELQRLQLVEK